VNPAPAASTASPSPSTQDAPPASTHTDARRGTGLLATYTAAVFLGAFLLFLVQPMFSRMALPLLGGTPAVWNTCMLFFQAALLGGYLYADVGARRLSVRAQAIVHIALLALAAVVLPVAVRGAPPVGGEPPIPWLLLRMAVTVGPPFFVLSATGPMLQRWFAHSGHGEAHNPYFLYAASNLGSMLALLGYPLVFERHLRLAEQSALWSAGYAALAVAVAACALGVRRGAAEASGEVAGDADAAAEPISGRERAGWVLLAFVPSGLMLSVTTFITTDVAPVPFFWVLPLSIYLLTFTLAFARRPPLKHEWMLQWQPTLLLAVVLLLLFAFLREPSYSVPLHLVGFFATAMVCHGELARRRPHARHLTEFYLWISVGGVLGGIFNVLVAPFVFPRMEEYALLLVVACLVRPAAQGTDRRTVRRTALMATPVLSIGLMLMEHPELLHLSERMGRWLPATLISIACLAVARFPFALAIGVGAALLVRSAGDYQETDYILVKRSFFGRYTVVSSEKGAYHALYHGSTLHGAQSRDPAQRRVPLTYYVHEGPLGQLFAGLPKSTRPRRVAVVGLGTGTAAAYARRGESWTFYEIDPGIERIARDPRYFTYLADSPALPRVVLGDARLSIANAPPAEYDLIVLDAFSSDAVPVHLLTSEALALYLRKLAPGGTVVYHLSNRYLDLEPVIGALAARHGLAARVGSLEDAPLRYEAESTWAAVARSPADLGSVATDPRWHTARRRDDVPAWTDDFSNLLSVFGRYD
jgi:SAM-dependent methyltransferase